MEIYFFINRNSLVFILFFVVNDVFLLNSDKSLKIKYQTLFSIHVLDLRQKNVIKIKLNTYHHATDDKKERTAKLIQDRFTDLSGNSEKQGQIVKTQKGTPNKPHNQAIYWGLSFGARDGNRTHDLLITNQLLYRLSHSSILSLTVNYYNLFYRKGQGKKYNFFQVFLTSCSVKIHEVKK